MQDITTSDENITSNLFLKIDNDFKNKYIKHIESNIVFNNPNRKISLIGPIKKKKPFEFRVGSFFFRSCFPLSFQSFFSALAQTS